MSNKQNLPSKKQQAEVPAYLTDGPALGVDNIDMSDIVIPRLKIVQGQTKLKANNSELTDGSWYHSVKEVPLGKSMTLYFLLKWNSRIIFDDKLKFVASEHTDYSSKQVIAMGEPVDDKDPRWKNCINYFVVTHNELATAVKTGVAPEVLIYSAMSSAVKDARKLNSHFKSYGQKKISMFAHKITATTRLDTFEKGNAYMPVFTPNGFASEKALEALSALYGICVELASTEAAQVEPDNNEEQAPLPQTGFSGPGNDGPPDEKPPEENPFGDM